MGVKSTQGGRMRPRGPTLSVFPAVTCVASICLELVCRVYYQNSHQSPFNMFSFHKPKVYRSTTGCCICKAKSSSSRFTDSKKYEEDFLECFQLSTPRKGEICNACVLLVKRWKKLPAGSDRNWRHVVDARAGPGMKSMTKFKSKHKKLQQENLEHKLARKKKEFEREYSPLSDKSEGVQDVDMAEIDFMSENCPSGGSRTNSPGGSDCDESVTTTASSRRHKSHAKRRDHLLVSEFIDMDYWKKVKICCGVVFEGANGDILVDARFLKPCTARLSCKISANVVNKAPVTPMESAKASDIVATKTYSDSSSDSGYDESSNQGAVENSTFVAEKKGEPITTIGESNGDGDGSTNTLPDAKVSKTN